MAFYMSICDKGFIWNPSNCECECDKSCDIDEYLEYENCNCRKKIVDKLVYECDENIDGVKLVKITHAKSENSYEFSSCTGFIMLFWIFFTISVSGIGAYFVYYKYANRNKENVSKYDYIYQTTN